MINNSTLASRIRSKSLLSKVGTAEDAARLITDGITLGITSGEQAACPKTFLAALREELARRSTKTEFRLFTAGPAPAILEDILTLPHVQGRKYGQLSSSGLRDAVNRGVVPLVETRLGLPSYQLGDGRYGKIDLAVLEAVSITETGHIVPSTSLLDAPANVALADKVIVEINTTVPAQIEGMHDVYLIEAPPNRKPVPITQVSDRIGTPYIPVNPDKIALVIESTFPDTSRPLSLVDSDSREIAGHLLEFLGSQVRHGRLPPNLLPLQFGIGSIPTAVLIELGKSLLSDLEVFSGSVDDGVLDLIDLDKVRWVSASALYFSRAGFDRLYQSLEHYKRYIVLRPAEVADCPEVISRLGIIAMNGAIEVDIYGHVNSTHISGSRSVGGIGGSCDFVWSAYLSVILLRSTAANGTISTIVPMVSHVDQPEHAVDVIVTDQGLADLRGLAPVERARVVIENCSYPAFRPALKEYLRESIERVGGHEPHWLEKVFSFHI